MTRFTSSVVDPRTLSIELLRTLLRHDPETGRLFWRDRPRSMFKCDRMHKAFQTKWAGKEALVGDRKGYFGGRIFQQHVFAHRLVYALEVNRWPVGEIDHIDGNTLNNAFSNLREVTHTENMRNQKRYRTSGTTPGITRHSTCNRWTARIGKKYIGLFETHEEACAARRQAERQHGYHENHGRAAS